MSAAEDSAACLLHRKLRTNGDLPGLACHRHHPADRRGGKRGNTKYSFSVCRLSVRTFGTRAGFFWSKWSKVSVSPVLKMADLSRTRPNRAFCWFRVNLPRVVGKERVARWTVTTQKNRRLLFGLEPRTETPTGATYLPSRGFMSLPGGFSPRSPEATRKSNWSWGCWNF